MRAIAGAAANRRPEQDGGYQSLVDALPDNTAFVDFVKVRPFVPGPRIRMARDSNAGGQMVAFLITPGMPVLSFDVGDVTAVKEHAAQWQKDLIAGRAGDAARHLRRLVWDPVEKGLPENIETVYIAPDGALSNIPWGALPVTPADQGGREPQP